MSRGVTSIDFQYKTYLSPEHLPSQLDRFVVKVGKSANVVCHFRLSCLAFGDCNLWRIVDIGIRIGIGITVRFLALAWFTVRPRWPASLRGVRVVVPCCGRSCFLAFPPFMDTAGYLLPTTTNEFTPGTLTSFRELIPETIRHLHFFLPRENSPVCEDCWNSDYTRGYPSFCSQTQMRQLCRYLLW